MKFFNRTIVVISLVAIINAIGYGIVIPLLYPYSEKFGLTDFENGLLFSLFSVCSFISTPIIGRMSDKYGRKPLLLISVAGTALSFFMQAMARNSLTLFFARALDGITAGNIPVASAVISDITSEEDRAKGFGIVGASFGFGFVFGPAIAALTVKYDIRLPFYIAGVVAAVGFVMLQLFLKETNKYLGVVRKQKLFDFKMLAKSLLEPGIGLFFLVTFLYSLAWANFIYAFQPFSLKVINLSITQIAEIFTGIGFVGVLSQGLLMPKVSHIFGAPKSFRISLFFGAITFFAVFFIRHQHPFMVLMVMLALANSFVTPLISTFLSELSMPSMRGSVLGINASYASLGSIFGPILGGLIAMFNVPYTFIFSSLLVLACWAVSKSAKLGIVAVR